MAFDIDMIKNVYSKFPERINKARTILDKPLSLSEKILYAHLWDGNPSEAYIRGKDYVNFSPDRVAMQDATAQMALLQFMQAGKSKVAVPSTTHADHLIQAKIGADKDLQDGINKNNEVFNFLSTVCDKYGIGFWKPGAGIIHQVVLENYAFPGGMMIGTDSHTVNAGGLGMVAIGVGGADAVDVMAAMPWELKFPKLIGIKLSGKLNGWTAPKDVILKVAGILTVKGGTGCIVEYFGEGAKSISCTGKGTICNMGAEIGATTSTFGYDDSMRRYLNATGRKDVVELADQVAEHLTGDDEVYADPEKYFDEVIEIDLSSLTPHLNGPFTPDLATPVSEMKEAAASNDWPTDIEWALIGSCTNSSYEDLTRAASIVEDAVSKGIKPKAILGINPGSEQVRYTAERDGLIDTFNKFKSTKIFTNACGPCIGQWNRPELEKNEKNSIVTTFNRNFPGRNDGQRTTLNFIGSPEMIIALALGGKLSFNPLKDDLIAADGSKFKLKPPSIAPEVPKDGFMIPDGIFVAPPPDSNNIEVIIDPNSKRLQRLEPFDEWSGTDFVELPIMVKAKGKCTTDHISPAGAWLSLRGHLDNLSDNMLLGAVNAYNDEVGHGKNILNNAIEPFSKIARQYKQQELNWVIVGDNNYGEGSSREHAAMTPRYLGCVAVITKSLARIHETNLKKQGVLALTFSEPNDYEKILEDDKISLINLDNLEPKKQVTCIVTHNDGNKEEILLNHSYNKSQIEWFKHGSALNVLRNKK